LKLTKPNKHSQLWFAFPDIHFPEHSPEALELALQAHQILKPTHSLFLGDVLDCGIFSNHSKKTIQEDEAYNYKEKELDPCNEMLDRVQKNTKIKTYYLCGNHEQRIERWAVRNGQSSKSLYKLISPEATIAKGRDNFEMIPYEVPTGYRRGFVQIATQKKMSGLVAVHGWSFARGAAKIHLDKSRSQSILFGHTHRQQVEVSRDPWTGHIIKAFNPGTLSKLEPLYAVGGAPGDWSWGFALIYVGSTTWTEYMINIVNNACVLPDGRELRL